MQQILMFNELSSEEISEEELESAKHFPAYLAYAVEWYEKLHTGMCRHEKNWTLKEVLSSKFGVKKGEKIYLYSGTGDWDPQYSRRGMKEFESELLPVVSAIRELGGKPILLSCSCRCREGSKRFLAEEVLKIPLVFMKKRR